MSDPSKQIKFADHCFIFDENGRVFQMGRKTLLGMEKLLAMSNFSFSCSVFKDLYYRPMQTRACLGTDYVVGFVNDGSENIERIVAIKC